MNLWSKLTNLQASFVNVATEDSGLVSVPLENVKMVKGASNLTFQQKEDSKGLIVRLNQQPIETTLRVMMLTNNFTWAPRYKMNLVGQTAMISAEACIINDSVDVNEFSELACLAGVPNLAFSHVTEPMAQMTDCSSFLSQLGSDGGSYSARPMMSNRNMMSNMMSQQMYGNYSGGGGEGEEAPAEDGAGEKKKNRKFF